MISRIAVLSVFCLPLYPVAVTAQEPLARDDNSSFIHRALELKTRGGFAELVFFPEGAKSTWYAALKYESVSTHTIFSRRRTGSA